MQPKEQLRHPVPGYLAGVAYPAFFHREQAPSWLSSVAAALGRRGPVGPARWCEIGCGQGFGATLLAAANPGIDFTAIDLNPDHIETARSRAEAAGLRNIRFLCADIRDEGIVSGPFDFIACHGVLSWVEADVRRAIAGFIGRHLGPDGLAALEYMSEPGGSAFRAFHSVFCAVAGRPDPVAEGLALLQAMRKVGAGFFHLHPHAADTLENLLNEPPAYVAHEYLNSVFRPLAFREVQALLAGAGLDWLGSATPAENIDAFSLPSEAARVIAPLRDVTLRETLKDIARNQALRYDLFARPAAPIGDAAHLALLRAGEWALLPGAPPAVGLRFSTRIGMVDADPGLFGPLIETLRHGPASFAALERVAPFAGRPGLLNQALQVGLWAGIAHPLVPVADPEPAERLNRLLLETAASGGEVPALAAPGLGTGLPVNRETLDALHRGGGDPLLRSFLRL